MKYKKRVDIDHLKDILKPAVFIWNNICVTVEVDLWPYQMCSL